MKSVEVAPRCNGCNLEMVSIPGKHRKWICGVCHAVCTRETVFQSQMKVIALLDQLLAQEERPEVREKIKGHLARREADQEHYKHLISQGVSFGDIESWEFSDRSSGEER